MTQKMDFLQVVNSLEAWNSHVHPAFKLTASQFLMLNQFQRFQLLLQAMPHTHYALTVDGGRRADEFIEQALGTLVKEVPELMRSALRNKVVGDALDRAHESCSPPFFFLPKYHEKDNAFIHILNENEYATMPSDHPFEGMIGSEMDEKTKRFFQESLAFNGNTRFNDIENDLPGFIQELDSHIKNSTDEDEDDDYEPLEEMGIDTDPHADSVLDAANEFEIFNEFIEGLEITYNDKGIAKKITKGNFKKIPYQERLEILEECGFEQELFINGHALLFIHSKLEEHLEEYHPALFDHYVVKYARQAIDYSVSKLGPPTFQIDASDSNDGNTKVFQLPRHCYYVRDL